LSQTITQNLFNQAISLLKDYIYGIERNVVKNWAKPLVKFICGIHIE